MSAPRASLLFLTSLLGILALAFACLNFFPIRLSIELAAPPGSTAQLFRSSSGSWNEQQSEHKTVNLAVDELNFRAPVGEVGTGVRFDPGSGGGEYRILAVRWQRGMMTRQLKPQMIGNLREGLQQLSVEGDAVRLLSPDADAQVFLPAPGEPWRLLALWPIAVVAAFFLYLLRRAWRNSISATAVASAYLALAAAVYVLVAYAYMSNLPLMDDWRYIVPGALLIVGDGYGWMTLVTNDTYFLTGQLLDFVALKLTNVNFLSVRWMGIGVLLVYLVAMRRALLAAGGSTLGVAVAIALVAGVLGTNGYWGATSLAYHQFIPLAVTAMLLAYVGRGDREIGLRGTLLVIVPLCAAAGLAYISGGLMIACVGAGLLLAQADRWQRLRDSQVRTAWLITLLGAAFLLLQVWLVSTHQGSLVKHNHAVGSVYPNDPRFLYFVTALFGRAAGYTGTNIVVDSTLMLLALFPALLLAAERLWNGLIRRQPAENPLLTALPLCAAAAALTYAAAVAFGRAGFHDPIYPQPSITGAAKLRFHFCTIAALLPMMWLGWVELVRRGRLATSVAAVVALFLILPKTVSSWRVADDLQAVREQLNEGAYCASAALHSPSNPAVICAGLSGIETDLRPHLEVMKALDSHVYRSIYGRPPAPPPGTRP